MRSFNRCVTCHAISRQTLLKVVEEVVTRLDKQPYIKHKWDKSVFRINGGVVDVHKVFTLEVELSWLLKLRHPDLRDELVARIQEAAEVEQGYVETKSGAVIWVNRAAIVLLLALWIIWVGWFM